MVPFEKNVFKHRNMARRDFFMLSHPECTLFFQSQTVGASAKEQFVTIGAPDSFVENFNIRLQCQDRKIARSLTRELREMDGGFPFVEALTLPYGPGHWEVACNLLRLVSNRRNACHDAVFFSICAAGFWNTSQ